jgi:SAM-dependent MidA family methyltransferase
LASPGNPALVDCLQELIRVEGAIPFDRFMQACLYGEGMGYYSQSSNAPGRKGDFYTSVSTGPVFGRLLADSIVDLWERHFSPEPLTIIEQGAHWGQLALDILDSLQVRHPRVYDRCRYVCVEPGSVSRLRQEERLASHQGKGRCYGSLHDVKPVLNKAFFLSNELLDSFPVKRILRRQGVWKECFIVWEEEKGFVEIWNPVTDSVLLQEIAHWQIPALEGYQAELCFKARNWFRDLGETLSAGFILTMDYGFMAQELYSPGRPQGTLSCYSAHRRDDNPLTEVGKKDITAHVNFSLLMEEGEKASWQTVYFKDQHHALIEAAQLAFLQQLEEKLLRDPQDHESRSAIRQFQTLTHPGIMGTQFKFLLQSKGI